MLVTENADTVNTGDMDETADTADTADMGEASELADTKDTADTADIVDAADTFVIIGTYYILTELAFRPIQSISCDVRDGFLTGKSVPPPLSLNP